MGGDEGPRPVVPAVLDALRKHPALTCELHGEVRDIEPLLTAAPPALRDRLSVIHSPRSISMDDKPANALRAGRESSMWRALESLADTRVGGCVSAGNTGALVLMSLKLIGPLEGIERPAICTALPTASGKAYLLDMGANLQCSAGQLLQFAHMATALVEEVELRPGPRVGLLNIGSEAGKGEMVVREAARLFAADESLNYCGFVEGDSIFSGRFDIVVCDGLLGNVALKTAEGVARLVTGMLRDELDDNIRTRLGALIARPALARLHNRLNPANYNGATLLGLNRTVIKSHGAATREGFGHAIDVALGEIDNNIPEKVSRKIRRLKN